MNFLQVVCFLTMVAPAAPTGVTPTMSLIIDDKPVALTNVRIQSATTTSGRPTFVIMGDVGKETIFVRATIPQAKPGNYTLRSIRGRSDEPRAWLNIDCRPESGVPVLRAEGGTLEVRAMSVNELEQISQLDVAFSGEMSVTAGTRHKVVLSIGWTKTAY
jgi:hypothetical protein